MSRFLDEDSTWWGVLKQRFKTLPETFSAIFPVWHIVGSGLEALFFHCIQNLELSVSRTPLGPTTTKEADDAAVAEFGQSVHR